MTKTKKGEMTISTIVAIALAVVVLIFLIYGFSTGWGNLWNKITAFGGYENNTDTIQLACQSAMTSNQNHTYYNLNTTDGKSCCNLSVTKSGWTCWNS